MGDSPQLRGTLPGLHGPAFVRARGNQGEPRTDHGDEPEVLEGLQVHQGAVPALRGVGHCGQTGGGVLAESEAVRTAGPPGRTQQVPQGQTGGVHGAHCGQDTGESCTRKG